ncbi:uncharacterized protein [Coffea arabica]|uniref:Reverse transcriptase domain-containing protein n=1 Tax=Coffea arabica TaxID=13443 RepID=A0ABM4UFN0_COFAR
MAGLLPPGGGAGRSFAAVLQNQTSSSSLSPCKIKIAAQFRGEPAVLFSEEDIAKLSAPFKFAVVGKFSHGRPSLEVIRKACSAIGFKSNFAVGLLDQRHILIRFCLEEDFLRCWTKGLWSIAEFPMRVFKWSPDFTVSSESSRAPVWIALEHLPIHFFDKASLFSIASTIGNPLQIDAATASLARPSVARLCVDLDISKELPARVWIGTGSHGFWQRVLYENLPLYCLLCSRQGHSSDGCRQTKQRRDGPRPATAARVTQTQEMRGGAQQPNTTHPMLTPVELPLLPAAVGQAQGGGSGAHCSTAERQADAVAQGALDGCGDVVHKGEQESAEHRYFDPAQLEGGQGVLQVTATPSVLGSICDDSQIPPAPHEKMPPQGSLSDGEELPEEGACDRRTLVASFQQFSKALGPRVQRKFADRDEDGFTMVLSRRSRKRRSHNPLPRQVLTRQAAKASMELPFSGSSYTWSGVRAGVRIWKRLGRVLINQQWLNFLPNTSVQHLNRATSNHTPLLVNLRSADASVPKPFKFQNFWVSSSDFKPTVQNNWELSTQGYGMYRLAFKLKRLKACLRHWSKQHFGNIFQAVRQNEFEVQQKEILFEAAPTDETRADLHRAKASLLQSLRVEEDYWRQKARLCWLKDGDSNTRYFHASVRKKRSKLAIHRIKDEGGIWLEDDDKIGQAAVCFFQRLLTAEEASNVDELLIHIPNLVSADQNGVLLREVTMEEVKGVVFELDGDSAPGADGFTGTFFRHCWDIVALDALAATMDFLAGTPLPKEIASTLIVLIPKKPNPATFADFRPISLCTFMNKIFTKVLANRLQAILPGIISLEQSAFCPGRDIAENVLLAQEMIASINKKTRGHNCIFKLDMMKAFDRVSWWFLRQLLCKFGFDYRFIFLILNNLSLSWFSVLVNGRARGFFQASRRIKQGDPLSPLLFILASEALSRGLNAQVAGGSVAPYATPRGCRTVTHLAFTDDVIIFVRGDKRLVGNLVHFLNLYQTATGQRVNNHKGLFISSRRCGSGQIRRIQQMTGFRHGALALSYLGCNLYAGRRKKVYFQFLIDKFITKLAGWQKKLLSQGGRLILIKHVLSAIPTHVLAIMDPPSGVLKELEQIMANFFWGLTELGPKHHWRSWEKLCFPVEEDGLGIRFFKDI